MHRTFSPCAKDDLCHMYRTFSPRGMHCLYCMFYPLPHPSSFRCRTFLASPGASGFRRCTFSASRPVPHSRFHTFSPAGLRIRRYLLCVMRIRCRRFFRIVPFRPRLQFPRVSGFSHSRKPVFHNPDKHFSCGGMPHFFSAARQSGPAA